MADLRTSIAGIVSPNPFWLASAPPTDKAYNVERAFRAGWGGVVWKTLSEDPPVVNVSSRYGAVTLGNRRMAGFNNIELISDRPLNINLNEIREVKKRWPDRAMVVSLMVPCVEESWKNILAQVESTGADGVELNFGCPHGMSERQMGSAVGQVPEYVERITRWCKTHSRLPVLVKLTPNITNILLSARAAHAGGADGVSLINTINSITAVNLDRMIPEPVVGDKGTHGGYCGPAVKPIALNMVAEIARDKSMAGLPISGIGGISNWRDAAEFIALGSHNVQVCTAAMQHGFAIVDDMKDGLSRWMDSKGYTRISDFVGAAVPNVTDWGNLNMNYRSVAKIDQESCVQCGKCYVSCEDTSHQAIRFNTNSNGTKQFIVVDEDCVGCNLCAHVCPVDNCISMIDVTPPEAEHLTWDKHPSNPNHRASFHTEKKDAHDY